MNRRAFTLVEMLAVIAIIAILASLLSAALARACALARQAQCEANLRQIALGWHTYSVDAQDWLVPNKTQIPTAYSTPDSWVVGSVVTPSPTNGITAGALFPYCPAQASYHCPADPSTNRSISMNPGFNWLDDSPLFGPISDSVMARKITQLRKPSSTFVVIDENQYSIDDGFFGISSPPSMLWINFPATRHHPTKTSLSFADGHTGHHQWRVPKPWNGYNTPPQSSDDLSDLQSLQCMVLPQ